jgi:iron(III) transport system permease protein
MTLSLDWDRSRTAKRAAGFSAGRLARSLRAVLARPGLTLAFVAGLLLLGAIVVYPVALLFKFGLTDAAGMPTLSHITSAFAQRGILKAALNSALLGFLVTAGCLALGLPTAWLAARTDMRGKTLLRLGAALAFTVPSFVTVIAWMFLAAPNSGLLNVIARGLFGMAAPFNIMSFGGLVFVEVVHLYPLVFFAVSAALATIDPSHEQAARLLGAGKLRTAVTVTLPLVMPAILSGAILCLLDSLSSFGAPAAIGTMANFSVLTTKIYDLLAFPPQLELAAAVSMPIVLVTLACLAVQRRLLGSARFRTVTGKAGAAQHVALGRARLPAQLACILVVAVTAILPLASIVILSLQTAFGADLTIQNLTLNNLAALLDPTLQVLSAVENSLLLAVVSAVLCLLLGVLFACLVERSTIAGRRLVTGVIMLAYGFPALAFAVGVMLGYISLLYGTLTILLIAYVAKKLPIAFVMTRSALKQLSPDLEDAARVAGAGWLRIALGVTLPLLKPSLWVAGMLVFSLALRELPMSAILTQPGTEVMSTTVIQFIDNGTVELAAAVALVIIVLSLAALLVSKLVAGRGVFEID